MSASLRWAAAQQGWHLELPEVDGFMWRGCDAAAGGEGDDDAVAAAAAADGFVQASARYVFSHARAACVWRDGSLQASPAHVYAYTYSHGACSHM